MENLKVHRSPDEHVTFPLFWGTYYAVRGGAGQAKETNGYIDGKPW